MAIVSRVGGTFKAAREGENVLYVLERAYTGRGHMDRTQTRTIFSPVGKGKSLATRGFVRNTEEECVSSTPVASPLRRDMQIFPRRFSNNLKTRIVFDSVPLFFGYGTSFSYKIGGTISLPSIFASLETVVDNAVYELDAGLEI